MKMLKQYFTALKTNTDDIRRKSLVAVGTTVAAVAAGIVLSKLSEDRVDVIVVEENRPEVPFATEEPSEL
jgi:hypothetical protein